MNYRHRLYAHYAEHFHRENPGVTARTESIFAQVYGERLPEDRSAAILDVGSGTGAWLSWMERMGYSNLQGVDPAAVVLSPPRSITISRDDGIRFLRAHPGKFDVIHARDVIEHLTKDEALEFCEAALAALRPKGQLWLLTFNAQAPFSNATRWGDFTHELGLTPSSAHQLLHAAGYTTIHVCGIHSTSRSVKGRIRGAVYLMLDAMARMWLRLRDGTDRGQQFSTCLPDLFISARAGK